MVFSFLIHCPIPLPWFCGVCSALGPLQVSAIIYVFLLTTWRMGSIAIYIASGEHWGPGPWTPHGKPKPRLGQKLRFQDSLSGLFPSSSCSLFLCLLWCHHTSGGQMLTLPNHLVRSTCCAQQKNKKQAIKEQQTPIHWASEKGTQNRSFPEML